MIEKVVLCFSTLYIYRTMAQGECTDVRGRLISHGLHYVPGPDNCRLCICDNGHPNVCKVVLCSPPQDCRSFRVGNSCCEFICLDDVVKPAEANDASFRMAAGGLAGVVLLCLILLLFRIKAQKRRRPPHADDQRSLTSIGYISGSMGYMGGMCETGMSAWKPPNNYMPRGEAPPPYDEAVAQSRAEAMRYNNETTFNRQYPASVDSLSGPQDSIQYSGHNYINLPRPIQQVANNQGSCFNAPLLRTVHGVEVREPPVSIMHHPLETVPMGFPSAIRLTGSLGTITNRGLLSLLHHSPPDHERPHNVPGFYTNTGALAMHSSFHRTIPRISTAMDATVLDAPIAFSRDRSLHNEIRRSFHKPNENRYLVETGRSMPRNLNFASNEPIAHPTPGRLRVQSEGNSVEPPISKLMKPPPPPPEPVSVPQQSTLPLTVDKPSCVCSYEDTTAPGTEETDDYRNECENCKSASSSRWVLSGGWSSEEEGAATLPRAPPPAPAPPATATLPPPNSKPRTTMGPPSNWENWFNTIPDSDSESEDD